ncbi:MAG: hypothetical protein GKR88_16115 [Flavobacteriaceae bacterium]|nr:MAG: hypothetical protein GKR88_16115 [Flavobacteriaceae bacterium]
MATQTKTVAPKNGVATQKGATNVAKKSEALNKRLPTDFTVQERISRLEHLRILVQKYSAVKTKENDMKTFLIEADGSQEYVIFFSGHDEKMRITNTSILKKLVQVIQSEMKSYRESVENDILSFSFDGEA